MSDDNPQVFKALAPGPVSVYANAMRATGGPFDVVLEFGTSEGADDILLPSARVAMSWEHTVSMLTLLTEMVERYEQEVGPIRRLEGALPQQPKETQA